MACKNGVFVYGSIAIKCLQIVLATVNVEDKLADHPKSNICCPLLIICIFQKELTDVNFVFVKTILPRFQRCERIALLSFFLDGT